MILVGIGWAGVGFTTLVEITHNSLRALYYSARIQQTMGLSALTAVQQAYRDRDMDEQRAAKMQVIYQTEASCVVFSVTEYIYSLLVKWLDDLL